LEKGSIDVDVSGKATRALKTGDGFGELALLYNAVNLRLKIQNDQFFSLDLLLVKPLHLVSYGV